MYLNAQDFNPADLIIIADACGTGASMRAALEGGPHGGGVEEELKFFGKEHEAARAVLGPLVVAINHMAPGFKDWLEVTRYGNDKHMIAACLEICNVLGKYRRPSDARIRPDEIPPPKHL